MIDGERIDDARPRNLAEVVGNPREPLGIIVELRYEGDDETEKYLVGSIEERQEGVEILSPGSPLGEALIGSTPGDVVSFESPSGATLKVEVVNVG